MKLRFLATGSIIAVISVLLLATRGFAISYAGLALVGLVLFTLGLLWK